MSIHVPARVPATIRAGVARVLTATAQAVTPPLAPGEPCPRHGEGVMPDPYAPGWLYCPSRGEQFRMRPVCCCPDHPGAVLGAPGGSGMGICPADGRAYPMDPPEVRW